jgi:hypothetical protein
MVDMTRKPECWWTTELRCGQKAKTKKVYQIREANAKSPALLGSFILRLPGLVHIPISSTLLASSLPQTDRSMIDHTYLNLPPANPLA